MKEYDHKEIESRWQKKWEKDGIYNTADTAKGKDNYYGLVEFAYPSGNLHVGHWYAFSVPDIGIRYKRMNGYNVLFPIGFDSFGLPAENAAIKNKKDPEAWTEQNIEYMKGQLRSMGASFDWDRVIATSHPSYYKWTQWMFTKFFENDLVYKSKTMVNWCPSCQTILANEQVVNGECERCGSKVIQKEQEQWSFRITKYADRLYDDLDNLDWPESIKESQRSWIGRKEGSKISFKIKDTEKKIEVFTTRADTLFGVTYVVLAPENNLISELKDKIHNFDEVKEYIEEVKEKSELERQQSKEKTGVELSGVFAVNPINGEEVPVWVSDYVLASYGTGSVMAVPAHDERDGEFAEKFGLPIKKVVSEENILENSGEFNGMSSGEAIKKITEKVGGSFEKTYRIRDWGISRQRYWGCPIPIVYDPEGKPHKVPEEHLPWLLPKDVDHTPDGTSPLARSKELKSRTEQIFGAGWTPEVETMDTFVDSSWYYYRYLDPKNENEFCSTKNMVHWMPVDHYSGGAEHTTMHLLYARFWNKALFDLGLVKESEPFKKRSNRGLILGPDGNKMSKSKGNVIDPDQVVEHVGSDTVRMYLAFIGPYGITSHYPWDPNGVVGIRRFLERIWFLKDKIRKSENEKVISLLHKTIKGIGEDIERQKYNTAISKAMVFINLAEKEEGMDIDSYKTLLKLMAPFAPHMMEEIWHELGESNSIHLSEWPKYNEELAKEDKIIIPIQVNGKVRDKIEIVPGVSEDEVKQIALEREDVKKYTEDGVKKFIYVQDKIVNIVV